MPGLARDFRKYLLNQVFDGFIALSVAEPLDDCSGFVEANTIGVGGYSRQPVTWDHALVAPTPGQPVVMVNTNVITWTSTAAWPVASVRPVAWWAQFDAATGVTENVYTAWAALSPARLVNNAGISITIPAGVLKLTMGLQQY